MEMSERRVDQLVADLVRRENRAARRSFVYTGIALLVSVIWLAYTVHKTQQLTDEARNFEMQIAEKRTELQAKEVEIVAKQEKLQTLSEILKLSPDELIRLYNFGYRVTDPNQVHESLRADSARKQIAASTDNVKRRNVVIEYFLKDVDREKVASALSELGFKLDIKKPINFLPTNAIWFGREVNPEDARLVAFTLMRAGVQLKEIRYFKRGSPRANSSLIQVGSNPELLSRPPLTVNRVGSLEFASGQ